MHRSQDVCDEYKNGALNMRDAESPAREQPWRAYWRAIRGSVLQPFLVDAVTVAVIVSLLWIAARLLIMLGEGRCGITSAHLNHATALLGLLYVVAMLGTVTRRLYYSVFRSGKLPSQSSGTGGAAEEPDTSV